MGLAARFTPCCILIKKKRGWGDEGDVELAASRVEEETVDDARCVYTDHGRTTAVAGVLYRSKEEMS